MSKECYVYIMASRSLTLYIGMTNDLERRAREHETGEFAGFSQQYRCDRLVYYETFPGPLQAIAREKQLKGWRREKKIALIRKLNPAWIDLSEKWGTPIQRYCWTRQELLAFHEALERARRNAGPSTTLRSAQDDSLGGNENLQRAMIGIVGEEGNAGPSTTLRSAQDDSRGGNENLQRAMIGIVGEEGNAGPSTTLRSAQDDSRVGGASAQDDNVVGARVGIVGKEGDAGPLRQAQGRLSTALRSAQDDKIQGQVVDK